MEESKGQSGRVDLGSGNAAEILPLVYNKLRHLAAIRLAHERPFQALQATALVHEAWLRLQESTNLQAATEH